jgi:hypothetical protein
MRSGRAAAVRAEAETREVGVVAARVTTGTPAQRSWQVVAPPEKGKVSRAMSKVPRYAW